MLQQLLDHTPNYNIMGNFEIIKIENIYNKEHLHIISCIFK